MWIINVLILCGWVVLLAYLIISAAHSKRNKLPSSKKSIVLRLAILILFLLIVLSIPVKNSDNANTPNDIVRIVGLVLFLLGLATVIWARINLGRNWGLPMTDKTKPRLVTSGPYHLVRHPIYAGIILSLLGFAFAVNVYWIFIFVIAMVFFIYSALVEEKIMTKKFPNEYPDYKKKTKMLIPFIL